MDLFDELAEVGASSVIAELESADIPGIEHEEVLEFLDSQRDRIRQSWVDIMGALREKYGPLLEEEQDEAIEGEQAEAQADQDEPIGPSPLAVQDAFGPDVAQILTQGAPQPQPAEDLPPDLWTPGQRMRANVLAIQTLARVQEQGRPLSPQERTAVVQYSGWGGSGMSLDRVSSQIPEGWLPAKAGLINEYYTPSRLCAEIARLVRPLLPDLQDDEGLVPAVEPAAGIGRFIQALSGPGFAQVRWAAIEYSRISALVLSALYPEVTVYQGPFEKWVAEQSQALARRVALVLANPPFGIRGPEALDDRDLDYRERLAQNYFLRRGLDLLKPGGLGIYVTAYGFLTSQSPAAQQFRQRVLLRHHLSTAYRLPSGLFPGTEVVTDVLFFRARGGSLSQLDAPDAEIAQGRYFELYPGHILGQEVGRPGEGDEILRSGRGYQVRGEFTGLPDLLEREFCRTCLSHHDAPPQPLSAPLVPAPVEGRPERIEAAGGLGRRVAGYLDQVSVGTEESTAQAAALHLELKEALGAWASAYGAPSEDLELVRLGRTAAELRSFVAAFSGTALVPALAAAPAFERRYRGHVEDVIAQAEHLQRDLRGAPLRLAALVDFHRSVGGTRSENQIWAALVAADWAFDGADGDLVYSPAEYYSGQLWPKYDRAKARASRDPRAAQQAARLLQLIAPVSFVDTFPEPRAGWIPLPLLNDWARSFLRADEPVSLQRHETVVQIEGQTYDALTTAPQLPRAPRRTRRSRFSVETDEQAAERDAVGLQRRLRTLIGYLNHDLTLFQPDEVNQRFNDAEGREETQGEALDRTRMEYGDLAQEHFARYLEERPEAQEAITAAYNRSNRGEVPREFPPEPIAIARWARFIGRGRPFVLHGYQSSAVRRVIDNRGGLIAHDVGLGKTIEGLAVLAKAREEGWARRPVVCIPNSLVKKWVRDFARALPDYRLVVIGAKQHVPRSGRHKGQVIWVLDTPEDRAGKWRGFQAGQYDAAIVTFSMLDRTLMSPEVTLDIVRSSPAIQAELHMDTRNLIQQLQSPTADASLVVREGDTQERRDYVQRERQEREQLRELIAGRNPTERQEAIREQVMARFVRQKTEPVGNVRPDPEVYWDKLGVDLFMMDEAQAAKNLFGPGNREGGVPQFLGAVGEGSRRAWQVFFRTAMVRRLTGGTGVVMLSATPFKNSPLEAFTMLSYVDDRVWQSRGIFNSEMFIDRYLKTEKRAVQSTSLEIKEKLCVVGFEHLDELRAAINRHCDFKTAEDVGLPLPQVDRHSREVDLNDQQELKYESYLAQYKSALAEIARNEGARFRILAIMVKMGLVALHPELDTPPASGSADEKKQGWQWHQADLVQSPHSPKIDACARRILERRECGHIVFVENVVVHRWLERVLVEMGFPQDRIAILNAKTAPTSDHRQTIADKFNGNPDEGIEPDYDVVIANSVAYEGIDLQVRTCEIAHLDLTWEPATLQQRNGRGVRQGNSLGVVEINYYLSRRSMDMAKFAATQGKRNWMVDLLKSMDRATNNPGAQIQMSPEDLLIYLSRNPEETRRGIEAQKARRAEAAQEASRKEAWRSLKSLYLRQGEVRREADPVILTSLHAQIERISTNLLQISESVWPWRFLVQVARSGVPMMFGGEGGAIWEGAKCVIRAADGTIRPGSFAIGRLTEVDGHAGFGRRYLGRADWDGVRSDQITGIWRGTTPEQWQERWPDEVDRPQADRAVSEQLVRMGRYGGDLAPLTELLQLGSDDWRQWLWEAHGAALVVALSSVGYDDEDSWRVPGLVGGRLMLLRGPALRSAEVLPFTEAGYQRFLSLTPARYLDRDLPLTALMATARFWWSNSPSMRRLVGETAAPAPGPEPAAPPEGGAQSPRPRPAAAAQPPTGPPRPASGGSVIEALNQGTSLLEVATPMAPEVPPLTPAVPPPPQAAPTPPPQAAAAPAGRFAPGMLEVDEDRSASPVAAVPPPAAPLGRFAPGMLEVDEDQTPTPPSPAWARADELARRARTSPPAAVVPRAPAAARPAPADMSGRFAPGSLEVDDGPAPAPPPSAWARADELARRARPATPQPGVAPAPRAAIESAAHALAGQRAQDDGHYDQVYEAEVQRLSAAPLPAPAPPPPPPAPPPPAPASDPEAAQILAAEVQAAMLNADFLRQLRQAMENT